MKINGREILFIEIKAPSPQLCGTKPTSRHEKHGEPQIDVEKYSSEYPPQHIMVKLLELLRCKRKVSTEPQR